MEKITTLALLHRGKLQRIHDAPPDSTTGLLQQVRRALRPQDEKEERNGRNGKELEELEKT